MKKNIYIWMCVLTGLAGLINALAIQLFSITVSHMTGIASNAVISVFEGNYSVALWLLSVMGFFLLGVIISAYVTGERNFFIKPIYGYIVVAIGILLFAGIHFLNREGKMIIRLFAFLMGAQNGMIVSVRGVLIRMTHLTGYITDFGVYIGYRLRGEHKEHRWTGIVPFSGIIIFMLGGILGLWLFSKIQFVTYDIVSLLYIVLGFIYLIYEKHSKDRNLNGIPDDEETEGERL